MSFGVREFLISFFSNFANTVFTILLAYQQNPNWIMFYSFCSLLQTFIILYRIDRSCMLFLLLDSSYIVPLCIYLALALALSLSFSSPLSLIFISLSYSVTLPWALPILISLLTYFFSSLLTLLLSFPLFSLSHLILLYSYILSSF